VRVACWHTASENETASKIGPLEFIGQNGRNHTRDA
jgi:hypothetical protein